MKERNQFLEMDGLFWESDTHEWFYDNSNTIYAQKKDVHGISLKVICFVVRNKLSGEYDRVIINSESNEIVYNTKRLEDIGVWIDMQKFLKHTDA